MATVEAKVFAHHYKNDGTYNVKIRVFHKDKFRFIDTEHCVSKNQVKKHPENKTELIIKDPFINKLINVQLDDYRIAISSLGNRLKLFNPDELKNYLNNSDNDIDFIK
ncbi:recombinase, partial [Pedobacter sp. MC2016-05]|nr:recombinase [Pedobacter sp. MC2016-05]